VESFSYHTLKAFETARLVMSRRNVDFDEKEAAILEHVFEETKMEKRIQFLNCNNKKCSLPSNEAFCQKSGWF
jgi:hypothetical protein